MAIACSNPCHIPDYYQCRQVDLIAHAEVVMLIIIHIFVDTDRRYCTDREVILATPLDIPTFPQVYYITGKNQYTGGNTVRLPRNGKRLYTYIALICAALLWFFTAYQGYAGQLFNRLVPPDTSLTMNTNPFILQVVPHGAHPVVTSTSTQRTTNPGPVSPGAGTIPAVFPNYLSFGVMNPPAQASTLDDMRSRNGAAFTFR